MQSEVGRHPANPFIQKTSPVGRRLTLALEDNAAPCLDDVPELATEAGASLIGSYVRQARAHSIVWPSPDAGRTHPLAWSYTPDNCAATAAVLKVFHS